MKNKKPRTPNEPNTPKKYWAGYDVTPPDIEIVQSSWEREADMILRGIDTDRDNRIDGDYYELENHKPSHS